MTAGFSLRRLRGLGELVAPVRGTQRIAAHMAARHIHEQDMRRAARCGLVFHVRQGVLIAL